MIAAFVCRSRFKIVGCQFFLDMPLALKKRMTEAARKPSLLISVITAL